MQEVQKSYLVFSVIKENPTPIKNASLLVNFFEIAKTFEIKRILFS